MRRTICLALLASGCAHSPPPTVRIEPGDTVVDLALSEGCDAASLPGWTAIDGAWLEEDSTLLVRARHCAGAEAHACGAMAPEEIYPGWFNVTVGTTADCEERVERVLRVDLSSARVVESPGLDRVDQRAIRPSATVGQGPQIVPIWLSGD